MKFTTEDEPDLTFPADTLAIARLDEVNFRSFQWTDRQSGETKTGENLEWWWTILETSAGEQFTGRKVRGQCPAKLSNRGDNKFRIWAEALLDRELPIGMDVDTDDLVGLKAEILITQEPDKKDRTKVWNRVTDVIPSRQFTSGGEPPF